MSSSSHPRSSRRQYQRFVEDYKQGRLDEQTEAGGAAKRPADSPKDADGARPTKPWRFGTGKRREYLREYLRWLWPHRYAVGVLFVLALTGAGLQMIEPLFMRFIIDSVLLDAALDRASRFSRLNLAGAIFVTVIVGSNLIGVLRDYRQRQLNTRVMLALRRSLFERLLHLPLPKLWDMKTGGILSRLTGDVDTTAGLLQMAIVSP